MRMLVDCFRNIVRQCCWIQRLGIVLALLLIASLSRHGTATNDATSYFTRSILNARNKYLHTRFSAYATVVLSTMSVRRLQLGRCTQSQLGSLLPSVGMHLGGWDSCRLLLWRWHSCSLPHTFHIPWPPCKAQSCSKLLTIYHFHPLPHRLTSCSHPILNLGSTSVSFTPPPRWAAQIPFSWSPLTWSAIRLMVGVMTMETFSVTKGGN